MKYIEGTKGRKGRLAENLLTRMCEVIPVKDTAEVYRIYPGEKFDPGDESRAALRQFRLL